MDGGSSMRGQTRRIERLTGYARKWDDLEYIRVRLHETDGSQWDKRIYFEKGYATEWEKVNETGTGEGGEQHPLDDDAP